MKVQKQQKTENRVDPKLMQILVCPLCKGKLFWDSKNRELWCRADMKAYPIKAGIPFMNPTEARDLTETEVETKEK
ncbi:MAG: Trm112 family protein [Burkholderiales bacterium]|nr:Trm112 family protein [Burkholderiales bacterium]